MVFFYCHLIANASLSIFDNLTYMKGVFFMRNRWLIALAAIGLHISIGSVYAWSVLTRPIMVDTGFTLSQTTWTFSLAILMLGLSAGFLGSFAEKIGPKKSGLLAMLFWWA
jgi:MFS transporter